MGELNVLGGDLQPCGTDPLTGFYRTGCCSSGPEDTGRHVVCAVVTEAFLRFSLSQGNDLISPMPAFGFPGLKAGNRWCLCAARWEDARRAGVAPPVVLAATHQLALERIALADLEAHAALG